MIIFMTLAHPKTSFQGPSTNLRCHAPAAGTHRRQLFARCMCHSLSDTAERRQLFFAASVIRLSMAGDVVHAVRFWTAALGSIGFKIVQCT